MTYLVVEDDELDASAMEKALSAADPDATTHRAKDGVEALETLRGDSIEKPYIVILDLNMPRMDGIEFLQNVREDEELKNAVVFVLTTSTNDRDRLRAYDLNAAGYIVKSHHDPSFVKTVAMINAYRQLVQLP